MPRRSPARCGSPRPERWRGSPGRTAGRAPGEPVLARRGPAPGRPASKGWPPELQQQPFALIAGRLRFTRGRSAPAGAVRKRSFPRRFGAPCCHMAFAPRLARAARWRRLPRRAARRARFSHRSAQVSTGVTGAREIVCALENLPFCDISPNLIGRRRPRRAAVNNPLRRVDFVGAAVAGPGAARASGMFASRPQSLVLLGERGDSAGRRQGVRKLSNRHVFVI